MRKQHVPSRAYLFYRSLRHVRLVCEANVLAKKLIKMHWTAATGSSMGSCQEYPLKLSVPRRQGLCSVQAFLWYNTSPGWESGWEQRSLTSSHLRVPGTRAARLHSAHLSIAGSSNPPPLRLKCFMRHGGLNKYSPLGERKPMANIGLTCTPLVSVAYFPYFSKS